MRASTFTIMHSAFGTQIECFQQNLPHTCEVVNKNGKLSLGGNHSPQHIDLIQSLSRHLSFPDQSNFSLIPTQAESEQSLCLVNDSGVYRAKKMFEERRSIYHHYTVEYAKKLSNLKISSVDVGLQNTSNDNDEDRDEKVEEKRNDEQKENNDSNESNGYKLVEKETATKERVVARGLSKLWKTPPLLIPRNEGHPSKAEAPSLSPKSPPESKTIMEKVKRGTSLSRLSISKSAPPRSFFMARGSKEDNEETEELLKKNNSPQQERRRITKTTSFSKPRKTSVPSVPVSKEIPTKPTEEKTTTTHLPSSSPPKRPPPKRPSNHAQSRNSKKEPANINNNYIRNEKESKNGAVKHLVQFWGK